MSKVFRAKDHTKDGAKPDGSIKTRGMEVIEDDPDTAWGMWDSALADMDSKFVPLPPGEDEALGARAVTGPDSHDGLTEPAALEEETPEQKRAKALETVEMHHPRVAHTIGTLWGYKECSTYIYKLLMNGGDGMGSARLGFHQDAADAMLLLAQLHDVQFGACEDSHAPGYGNPAVRAGFDGAR
ncbi:MAG: hypothetical protein KJ614_12015 [Gammaproteobacteria bacterium]|uniref:hypothetical protein n=1 Tax=Rhodoferax sp. TaxID=50421 RepID=UPI0017C49515|nr:hypothetical protein [Rhodoferax sp.]MBU3899632.1 hypothetical protein [Gammaproteobacteria bacterium]MBA3056568.1 hypothetical protein [Rhodoferax sp.]MBU3998963.1 hypothetical protein [Gammaproteobacteria bacterium]MBU4018108.1 hypothetical protein [Gammaproteobacteria bacterium]MBU4080201.1 hypothetical protein [Gammaproteobacteria bacterium]